MLPDQFIKTTVNVWSQYLSNIQTNLKNGKISLKDGFTVLFPNILLITVTKEHFLVELIGANKKYTGLTVKRHKEQSTFRYLHQFTTTDGEAMFNIGGGESGFRYLCLAHMTDLEALEARFPAIKLFRSRLVLNRPEGYGSLFNFMPDFISTHIDNCILVNRNESLFRAKHILSLIVVKKNIQKNGYIKYLEKLLNEQQEIKGVHVCSEQLEQNIVMAGQLQNLYLLPGLRETTIGEFISTHPEVLSRAFNSNKYVYEPYLPWLEGPDTNLDEAINPDLLIQRPDGYYDILDLKTAALMKKKLTKGPRKRRRFIDYVNEGIAQLANYREYFTYEKNREYAANKFGVKVQNPNLILVVGNYENFDPIEVEESARQIDKRIVIIDYDTIIQSLIAETIGGTDDHS
jgi:hypothetical protein